MARVEHVIDAAPEAVFEVLADPRGYAYWVIGSIKIRDAEPEWPAPGSRFHHTVGIGPLRLQDHTAVEKMTPGRFLQLKTRARPMGNARVELELAPHDRGTRVTMTEEAADKPTSLLFLLPLTHVMLRRRNRRSLQRLAELAEGRRPMPGDEAEATVSSLAGDGSVLNPEARRRHRHWAIGLAAGAGLVAGAVLLGVRAKR